MTLPASSSPPALPAPRPADLAIADLVDQRTRALIERRRAGKTRRRGWLVRRALAAADVVGLLAAFVVAQALFGETNPNAPVDRVSPLWEVVVFAVTLPGWIVLARLYGLYAGDETRADHSTVDDVVGVLNMVTFGTWVFFTATWLTGIADPTIPKLVTFWAIAVVGVPALRVVARALCRRTDTYLQNTIVVGAGHVGQRVAQKLIQHPEYGVNVVGFVDDNPRERAESLGGVALLGGIARLPELCAELDVERVIVAFSLAQHPETLELIRELNSRDVQVDVVPRLFEALGAQAQIHAAEGLPLIALPPARLARSSLFLKRALDLTLACFGLLVLAPLLAAIAIAIKLDSPGPVLFRQVRMGRGGRTFRILKFRTMSADADERKAEVAHLNKHLADDPRMFKIPDDPRVTRVGRFLRRASLDELPQLFNVLRGEMSLVGPRPIILDEHQHVNGWALRRLDLKPGITGLWQVLGRDDIPFEEMVQLDYQYVTSWTLAGDLKLIARTIPVLLAGQHGA
ncbi:MAG TPA: sugar transferase [Gaiellaceae bacterium]|nr:sugar transferase [Gaiellaceae bacterium]